MTSLVGLYVNDVDNRLARAGYKVTTDYEDGRCYVVEYSKVGAGVVCDSVTVVFNRRWKCIEVYR